MWTVGSLARYMGPGGIALGSSTLTLESVASSDPLPSTELGFRRLPQHQYPGKGASAPVTTVPRAVGS